MSYWEVWSKANQTYNDLSKSLKQVSNLKALGEKSENGQPAAFKRTLAGFLKAFENCKKAEVVHRHELDWLSQLPALLVVCETPPPPEHPWKRMTPLQTLPFLTFPEQSQSATSSDHVQTHLHPNLDVFQTQTWTTTRKQKKHSTSSPKKPETSGMPTIKCKKVRCTPTPGHK